MAGVFIDIPGIGNVEAKNAATEATLREILKAMQGVQKNTTGGGGGGGGGGDAGSAGGKAGPTSALGKAASKASEAMGKVAGKVMPVIGGFARLSDSIVGTISDFAKVGDSVEAAAGVFNKLPILGTLFSAVAASSQKVNDAFLAASKSGASFGGSVSNLAASASAAGMTMDKFGAMVARNGDGMLGFGGTTEEGAKRFAQVSKALRATSSDLYALGFSTEDINQGLASYGSLMRTQGLQGKQSNSQMVDGAKKYLKELDAMAKITGEERSAKEAQMKALAQDAQFQAAMAGQSADARQSFLTTVGKIPGPLQGFVKDFLATGTLTTEETQRIGAMMGGEVMQELQSMRNKMQSGQALTAEEQDRLAAIMKKSAEQQLKNAGTSLAGATEMHGATAAVASALQINTDANKKAAAEQNKAAKEGDGFNKRMQQIQQTLAQFSNAFNMALANSGVLDFMMKMFTGLANLVLTFVVPAFNILASVITTVGNFLINNIQPVFQAIGEVIQNHLYPAFLSVAAFVIVDLLPPLQEMARTVMEYVNPVLEYMGGIINDYVVPAWESIAGFVQDNLEPIMVGLATAIGVVTGYYLIKNGVLLAATAIQTAYNLAMTAGGLAIALLTSPISLIVIGITALVAVVYSLYKNGFTLSTAWEALKSNLELFGMTIMDFVDNIRSKLPSMLGGISEEEAAARKEEREERKKALADKEAARDVERKKVADERESSSNKKARDQKAAELDKKIMSTKTKFAGGIGKTADTVEAANKTLDTNQGEIGLLKDFAKQEGSPLVPTDKKEAAAKAEATKKEIEAKGEAKTAAEEKARQEAEAKKEAEKKANEGKGPAAPAQESAESLLAQLNSNMAQLIRLNQEQKDIGERQLSVQRSLTGDLFASV
jgi:hypothetical protein